MTDNSSLRVSELEKEISTLKEMLGNMEQQLIMLYKEKDVDHNSELSTVYQSEKITNLSKEN